MKRIALVASIYVGKRQGYEALKFSNEKGLSVVTLLAGNGSNPIWGSGYIDVLYFVILGNWHALPLILMYLELGL